MRGHIHKRIHVCKNGQTSVLWYVVVDVGRIGGRRRQQWHGGFRTRREAEVTQARVVTELHANRYVNRSQITVERWVSDEWLPTMKSRVKPSTLRSYRQIMSDYLVPALGERPLQKLTAVELDQLYAEMLSGAWSRSPLSLGTVANVHRAVHKALADAVDAGMAGHNPAERAKPPRPRGMQQSSVVAWQPAELASFLDATADDRLAAVWRLAAMTGMRRGEIIALRWGDVNLTAARLAVRRALIEVDYRVIESSPKGRAARTVDLDRQTVQLLSKHQLRQSEEQEEWGDAYERNGLVASWENGTLIHPQTFSHRFQNLIKKARLRRIRLHDLRHTHATLLLQAGIPVMIVAERLGHASPAFTLQRYAHALPNAQAAAAAAVADLVAAENQS